MIKNFIKHYLGQYPSIFYPVYNLIAPEHNKSLLCNRNTDIVIEGFPRCANTFAGVYFEKAQTREFKIAHHLHVEAQIIRAVKLNKPVLVLIQEPEDTIRSLLVRHSETSIPWAITRYINFYSNILPYKGSYLLANFDELTHNMNGVIQKINDKFSTNFLQIDYDDSVQTEIFGEIDSINRRVDSGIESQVSRPSKSNSINGQKIDLSNYKDQLATANSIYKQLNENT
jgi:hypothetical protein